MRQAPRADKSFGQHFLVNEGVVARIADRVEQLAGAGREAVEIGPGPGALTGALLARGLRVRAVELDKRMKETLEERFAEQIASGQFSLLLGDAIEVPMDEVRAGLRGDRIVLCGNLPYNVGTEIVFRFLEECPWAASFCYMLQKEVVLRLLAGHAYGEGERADYGVPSAKLAWCTRALDRFWVKPGSFAPPPKVDSGVFSLERLTNPPADPLERGGVYDRAAEIVGRAFRQRRKKSRNSVPELDGTEWGEKRPDEISPTEYLEIARRKGA